MQHKILTLDEMNVIGLELRTTNANNQAAKDIPSFWQKFYGENWLAKIPNKINAEEILGLYTNYAGDYTQPYSLIIGCKVTNTDEVPSGMVSKIIPAATYAVFTAKGKFPDCLIQTWQTIWNSGLNRAYTADFEVYDKRAQNLDNAEVDVYIAISNE